METYTARTYTDESRCYQSPTTNARILYAMYVWEKARPVGKAPLMYFSREHGQLSLRGGKRGKRRLGLARDLPASTTVTVTVPVRARA